MSGYVHVYTGDGKGKTTAALGLALRAAGAGWNVFFAQFAKGMATSEQAALARFNDRITIRQYGQPRFILHGPGEKTSIGPNADWRNAAKRSPRANTGW